MWRAITGFVPTVRLALLFLLGAPLLGASVAYPWLLLPSWSWLLLVAVAACFDHLAARSSLRLRVERRVEERLSVGARNRVALRFTNEGEYPLALRIRDDCPSQFEVQSRDADLLLPPHTAGEVVYWVRPPRRGDYLFGDVHARVRSPLGLSLVQHRLPARQRVQVYPNLMDVRKYSLLARRSRLREGGFKRARARGEGTEFESLREYLPDDEYRRIDWKATARRAKPMSRNYEEERSQNILIAIDAGRLMSAELEGLTKLDHAVNAGLMLAYVGAARGDNVGALVFADTVKAFLPPRRGKPHLSRILDTFYAVQAELCEPDYAAAFRLVAARSRKRALVVIFTDLVDPESSRILLGHIASLAPHHLPLCVAIADQTISRAAAADPETPEQAYQKAVAEEILGQRHLALAALRHGGALVLDVPPGRMSIEVVNRYLALKAEGRL